MLCMAERVTLFVEFLLIYSVVTFVIDDEVSFLLFDIHIVRLGTICFSVYNLHTLNWTLQNKFNKT